MERSGSSQGSNRQNSIEKCTKQSSIDRCTRHVPIEQTNRQSSVDSESSVSGVSGVRSKDIVHKCHSDPGGGKAGTVLPKVPPRPFRFRASGGYTRKCVLTLDGYSYVIVASPPDRRGARDDAGAPPPRGAPPIPPLASPHPPTPPARNGQLAKQGSLTIVRRSSGKQSSRSNSSQPSSSPPPDHLLDQVDLSTDNLPPVDTPDACDKAALRLRCVLRQLHRGELPVDVLQKNLNYAARVLEAVFIDETNSSDVGERSGPGDGSRTGVGVQGRALSQDEGQHQQNLSQTPRAATFTVQKRRLRTPVWARPVVPRQQSAPTLVVRRLADEDDELSEVQPDAVPPEVREWLASTFTRQLATTKRKNDEKPKFRSVAHAIRAGIFVDRIYRRVSNSAMMQFPPEVVKVLKTLDDWSFDVFSLAEAANNQPVKYLGYDLLNRYGIIHKFKVPPITLELFLTRIEEGYCRYKNPYHNNLHAADVSQSVHYMLCQTGLMNWLTDLEIFATLVAALIHDFEHTGTTNNFHVMSGSDIALMYNDKAVLENHHISAAFRVMKEDECNILQNLSRDEFREFRTLVIDMVLATDMSFHFQQIKNMRNLLTLAEPSVDKSKAVSLILHCCDISHPAKKWDIHNKWTMLLLEEFFRQGDKEQELGLPFSPLCDRNNTLVAESQIGFIEFIVEPSMGVCADMLEYILAPLHSGCKTNSPSQGSTETIQEDNMESTRPKNGQTGYKFKKPWIYLLAENKQTWKEQAAKDAEARALAKKEEEAKNEE